MKIQAISNQYYPNRQKTNNKVQFQGLYAEYGQRMGCSFFQKLLKYHPFADESSREIAEAISTNNFSRYSGANNYMFTCVTTLGDNLPITKIDWANYIKNKATLPGEMINRIEQTLEHFGLSKYVIK